MSETSILWLKALIIEMGSCPLMYVWMVIFVNILIFIGRNTKGEKKQALWLIICVIFLPFIVISYVFLLRLGYLHYGEKTDWAFFIWVTFLHILALTPSYLYMFRKRRSDLLRVGYLR